MNIFLYFQKQDCKEKNKARRRNKNAIWGSGRTEEKTYTTNNILWAYEQKVKTTPWYWRLDKWYCLPLFMA